MLQISPIEIVTRYLEAYDLKADVLVSSSSNSWHVDKDIAYGHPLQIPKPKPGNMKSYPLAVLIQGKTESFFKDYPLPEPPPEISISESSSGTFISCSCVCYFCHIYI